MKQIEANVIADSVHEGSRITTFLLTYPRMIHGELMTHRVFSRNSASSRAIPFNKMVEDCEKDPFIPIAWQKDHKGMQGTEYFEGDERKELIKRWIESSKHSILQAKILNANGLTKQLCNRVLEPFMWHTVLVTATEFENFFELRCPKYDINWYPKDSPERLEPVGSTFNSRKDALARTEGECEGWSEKNWREVNYSGAEIHIQALAECMWDAYKESVPIELEVGEWHIPFGDKINNEEIQAILNTDIDVEDPTYWIWFSKLKLKVATARCARLSYMTFDGKIDYKKDIELHDLLLADGHLSPFEHCAKVPKPYNELERVLGMTHIDREGNLWSGNFKDWIQYRQIVKQ